MNEKYASALTILLSALAKLGIDGDYFDSKTALSLADNAGVRELLNESMRKLNKVSDLAENCEFELSRELLAQVATHLITGLYFLGREHIQEKYKSIKRIHDVREGKLSKDVLNEDEKQALAEIDADELKRFGSEVCVLEHVNNALNSCAFLDDGKVGTGTLELSWRICQGPGCGNPKCELCSIPIPQRDQALKEYVIKKIKEHTGGEVHIGHLSSELAAEVTSLVSGGLVEAAREILRNASEKDEFVAPFEAPTTLQ